MTDLIYDWASGSGHNVPVNLAFVDESPRDGLQSPSVAVRPTVAEIIEHITLMDELGIEFVDVGLPVTPQNVADITEIIQEMARRKLSIRPQVACRTVVKDIEPVPGIVEKTGVPIEVCTFVGSSPIRLFAEDWTVERLAKLSEDAVTFCVRNNLKVKFVTEDTIRTPPAILETLFGAALGAGANGLTLCDTVGGGTPEKVQGLMRFARRYLGQNGFSRTVTLDWHGHNDLGQGLECAMVAAREGAHNIHGTVLGIGERAGNVPMELLLINAKYRGFTERDLSALARYVELGAKMTGVPIPVNYPCFGADVLTTQTGVHAAAMLKAQRLKVPGLVDAIYSAVPASEIGRHHTSAVGPMSGKSNLHWLCNLRGIPAPPDERVDAVLARARTTGRILPEAEVISMLS